MELKYQKEIDQAIQLGQLTGRLPESFNISHHALQDLNTVMDNYNKTKGKEHKDTVMLTYLFAYANGYQDGNIPEEKKKYIRHQDSEELI